MNLLILIIELTLLLQFAQCSQLIVNTTCGTLIGLEFTTANGRIVAAFHGIPFAKPPLGELRFQVKVNLTFSSSRLLHILIIKRLNIFEVKPLSTVSGSSAVRSVARCERSI